MDCTRPSCWKHRLHFCLTFRGQVRLFLAITPENGFDGWNAAAWYKIMCDHSHRPIVRPALQGSEMRTEAQ